MHDSDYVMTFNTAITSIPNTPNKLLLQYNLYSSCNQTKNIVEDEIIHNIFTKYVEPLLDYINNPALVQEWKLNPDATAYEKN